MVIDEADVFFSDSRNLDSLQKIHKTIEKLEV